MSRGHMREGLECQAKESGLSPRGKKKAGKMLSKVKDMVGTVF